MKDEKRNYPKDLIERMRRTMPRGDVRFKDLPYIDRNIPSDVLGSYTGMELAEKEAFFEPPVQDTDDL